LTAKGVPIDGKRSPIATPQEESLFPKGGVPLAAMGLRFKTESHGETTTDMTFIVASYQVILFHETPPAILSFLTLSP
jgi:hypothetical protein